MKTIIETSIDRLFFHLYIWARGNDDDNKVSQACHMISFFLIAILFSIASLATLILPKQFVIALTIGVGILLFFVQYELEARYEDERLRKTIIKRYSPTTGIKSFLICVGYYLLASFPLFLIILIEHTN